MKKWVFILSFLLFFAGVFITLGYWWIEKQIRFPIQYQAQETIITINSGLSANEIGEYLAQQGFIKDPFFFRWYLYWKRPRPLLKAGRFSLSKSMNIPTLVDILSKNPIPEDIEITFVDGWTMREMDQKLASDKLLPESEYLNAAHKVQDYHFEWHVEQQHLEGYLFPETYRVVPKQFSSRYFIQKQIDTFAKRFFNPYRDEIEQHFLSLNEIVILASMVEREERNEANRPLVAGIMLKRLKQRVPLGIDATSRYSLENWKNEKQFLLALRNPDDPYNTRLRKGLPPTPICSPNISSLLAVLTPRESTFWYYLHDDNGNIHFGKSAEEHEANRRKYHVY